MAQKPQIRVVVRLPYNRPQEADDTPPRVEWTLEKENLLWEVIARSRAPDSGGPDWTALAEHFQVPLPYLLYRAQLRYEEDLRGLQDLKGAFGPITVQAPARPADGDGRPQRPDLKAILALRSTDGSGKLSSSSRMNSPLTIRARLNSLVTETNNNNGMSSSTATLQGTKTQHHRATIRSPSPPDSPSDSDSGKEEEQDRRLEEQDALDQKLKRLQTMMTGDALGFVRSARPPVKRINEQGRDGVTSPTSPLRQSFRRNDLSSSEYNSATSSPQGSIPSIPSPSSDSLSQSPAGRHITPARKTSSPPAVSSGHARGQSNIQYRPIASIARPSERSSSQGSNASSFSDISLETSLSASALESALMSNIRGNGSRFSMFTRSPSLKVTSRQSSNTALQQ